MKQVVIAGCCRTPIGVHGGAIKDLPAQRLAEIVFRETLARTKVDPALIDEVILGCIAQPSEAANVGPGGRPDGRRPHRGARLHRGAQLRQRTGGGQPAPTAPFRPTKASSIWWAAPRACPTCPTASRAPAGGSSCATPSSPTCCGKASPTPSATRSWAAPPRTWPRSTASHGMSRMPTPSNRTRRPSWPPAWASSRRRSCPCTVEKKVAGKVVASEPITQDEGINPDPVACRSWPSIPRSSRRTAR